MGTVWQDVRYGIRMLAKNRGFTAVAVLTLALGIGANTAIFSVVDRLLFRPLPVRDPQRLALLAQPTIRGAFDYDFNYPLFRDLQRESTAFEALCAVTDQSVGVQSGGTMDRRRAMLVSDNYFSMLGVNPALGRLFHPEEAAVLDSTPLAVLSYQLWMTGFGGDPGVIGRAVSINRQPYTIIGVTPREFAGTERGRAPELYLPITMLGQLNGHSSAETHPLWNRQLVAYQILGRLKPGIRHAQAQAVLQTIAKRISAETPQNTPTNLVVLPGAQGFTDNTRDARLPLQLLFAIASLILLLICANLANLQMARSTARAREFAIRLALGTQRWRLIRLLLGESFLLAGLGGGLGLIGAFWLGRLIESFHLPQYQFDLVSSVDSRVLWFGFGISVLTGIIFGLAPALRAGRSDLVAELRGAGSAAGMSPRRFNSSSFLVGAQIAASVVVLAGAGLCTRSLWKIYHVDSGFDPSHLILLTLDATLDEKEEPAIHAFYDELLSRVRALPGVKAAGLGGNTPLGGRLSGMSIARVDGYEKQPDERPFTDVTVVSPDYFRTLGIPLVRGREFSQADVATGTKAAIVDQTFVQRYLAGQDPIGHRIYVAGPPEPPQPVYEIVGVVGNTHKQSLTDSPRQTMFLPTSQHKLGNLTLIVRTDLNAPTAIGVLREAVRAVDPGVPILSIRTMEQQLAGSLGLQRLVALLLMGFGLLAMILASLGVYGVLAYSVSQRTREFGVRRAMGACVYQVIGLVMRQGLTLVVIGMGSGLVVAVVASRFLRSFLYEIEPVDPVTFALVLFLLGTSAAFACFLPARRAAKVDPITALRCE